MNLVLLKLILIFISTCDAFFNNKNSAVKEIDASTFDRDVIKNEVLIYINQLINLLIAQYATLFRLEGCNR